MDFASLVNAYTSSGASKTVNAANNADGDGPRHGTVITVTDPVAKQVIWNLRKNASWKTSTPPQQSTFIDVNNQSEVLANNDWSATPHASDIGWLADAKVSGGWLEPDGSRTFRGMDSVRRQDMAAFLYRLAVKAGRGGGVKPGSFRDVSDATPHASEVRWLGGSGVSTGYADGTFRGMLPVYRQDMAAFLHRFDGLK